MTPEEMSQVRIRDLPVGACLRFEDCTENRDSEFAKLLRGVFIGPFLEGRPAIRIEVAGRRKTWQGREDLGDFLKAVEKAAESELGTISSHRETKFADDGEEVLLQLEFIVDEETTVEKAAELAQELLRKLEESRSPIRLAKGARKEGATARAGGAGVTEPVPETLITLPRILRSLLRRLAAKAWVHVKATAQGLVAGVPYIFGWGEPSPWDERGEPQPILFRPSFWALLFFWIFFGSLAALSAYAFMRALGSENETALLVLGLWPPIAISIPTWQSCRRLTIRLDARFVYSTLLYSIVFLPTGVRKESPQRGWVLEYDPGAKDPDGRPSVVFQPKGWLGGAAVAARKELFGDRVTLENGLWNLEEGSYMADVLGELQKAVQSGSPVDLW